MKKTAFLTSLLVLALLALPAAAVQTGHAVYRPGLTQARIPLGSEWGYKNTAHHIPNLTSNLLGLVKEDHASIGKAGILSKGDSACWYGDTYVAFVHADRFGAVCDCRYHPIVREVG